MTNELYFDVTLVSKNTLKTLPLVCMKVYSS